MRSVSCLELERKKGGWLAALCAIYISALEGVLVALCDFTLDFLSIKWC
jgi:hypothetical protein